MPKRTEKQTATPDTGVNRLAAPAKGDGAGAIVSWPKAAAAAAAKKTKKATTTAEEELITAITIDESENRRPW